MNHEDWYTTEDVNADRIGRVVLQSLSREKTERGSWTFILKMAINLFNNGHQQLF